MRKPGYQLSAFLFLTIVFGAFVALFISRSRVHPDFGGKKPGIRESAPSLVSAIAAIEERERQMNETVWSQEMLAEECGAQFENLWDSFNAASNRWTVAASFQFAALAPPVFGAPEILGEGILSYKSTGTSPALNPAGWRQLLGGLEAQGWVLQQMEIRHNQFKTDLKGQPKESTLYFSVHLENPSQNTRGSLQGDLRVEWLADSGNTIHPAGARDPRLLLTGSEEGGDPGLAGIVEGSLHRSAPAPLPWRIGRIDASGLRLIVREGTPVFERVFQEEVTPPERSYFIDPLIVYDLNGDGLSEIILAAKNLVLRQRDNGTWGKEPLCQLSSGLIFTGVIADFDRDGAADFLCAKFEGLVLFRGTADGRFPQPGEPVWMAQPHLKYAQELACGDIDGDGDLDVWLGQYKVPYAGGQMPTPYFDANDGDPSYLLVNDGNGAFSDHTKESHLDKLRWRRCYSGSLSDLDDDGDLDLAVVSDFAGIDLYRNNGVGVFENTTAEWVENPRGFGMAHSIADFNGDGSLDLLMIGMNSPSAERLEGMALDRPGLSQGRENRAAMIYGNRLYLRRESGTGFEQTALNRFIQRSGWSWGCAAFDWDNDGYQDLYIANGHESKETVRDYETEFWLHDIYVGNSQNSRAAESYFAGRYGRTRGRGFSYGGYEKNRLYWNRGGESFTEIAPLMGVALEQDSRNVVADDLDGDGRSDLIVTTFEAWPRLRQTLQVFRNKHASEAHWIGFRLREQGGGVSPVGVRIRLEYPGGIQVREIVTGDSFRSQHSNVVLFGLGHCDSVKKVEIRWASGLSRVVTAPQVDQYHLVVSTQDP